MRLVNFVTVLFAVCTPVLAHADFESADRQQMEVALTAGTFLPWTGIPGVKEQLRMWGGSFFVPTRVWNFEFQALTARGHGIVYHTASVGVRSDFILEKSLETFIGAGLDYHAYQRSPFVDEFGTETRFGFKQKGGFHLEFGGFFAITDSFKLRGNFKFFNGPGRSAYVGLGPTILF